MSNQLQITGGAKVRNLQGVITGTSGVLSSVPLGAANGVATLDSSGKVPVSQLPSSVVTYLGTWNAATNTPTLTNGTGDAGDLYICNVAGTANFGAGPITFAVGDWVIYGTGTWQKSSGQNGTVTSVAASITGNAIGITGSPITTAGTLAFAFAGSSTQYIAGDGTLVTFPTIITEAQNLITDVYNETGATLTKGTVVYINGGHGNLPTVTKALATSDATSAQTYGVVQADITNNNNGHVVVIGRLENLDTQSYANGTQLYLSSTTAGAWTSTKQYAPAHLVYVGIVTRSHPTQGVVEVKIQNGYELDELHNVSAQTPLNNQGIFYNSSNSLWENKSIATALGYTPANDALVVHLAGTETITGAKTFSATTLLNTIYVDGVSYLKHQSTTSYISGYTTFSAKASGVIEYFFPTSFKSVLDFNDSADYTYTFPAASGTIALTSNLSSYVTLGTSQTISGSKIFSNDITFSGVTFGTNGYYSGTVQPTNGIVLPQSGSRVTGSGLTTISVSGTNGIAVGFPSGQLSSLAFPTASSNTYTFPAASGTIALTSDLSSYVTLGTSQTISGSKIFSGTSLFTGSGTFSSALQASTGILFPNNGVVSNGAGVIGLGGITSGLRVMVNGTGYTSDLVFSSTVNYTYTFPSASGTLALTSNLSSYLPLTGGTLTGDLTLNNGAADGAQLVLASSGYSDWNIDNYSGTLRAYYGASVKMSIASTGAATFSSSVTASNLYAGSNTTTGFSGAKAFVKSATSTDYEGLVVQSSSNSNSITIAHTGTIGRIASTYGTGGTGTFTDLAFATSGVDRLTILSSGNVGIGTSSPQDKLHVAGAIFTTSNTVLGTTTGAIFDYNDGQDAGRILTYKSTGSNLLFYTNANGGGLAERLRITSGGGVSIGTTINAGKIHVLGNLGQYTAWLQADSTSSQSYGMMINAGSSSSDYSFYVRNAAQGSPFIYIRGDGYLYSASAWSGSDRRLKENIVDLDNGLNKVLELKARKFDFIDGFKNQYGFIAQELQEVIPDAVSVFDEEKELLAVKMDFIIPHLVKAIQELKTEIDELKNK